MYMRHTMHMHQVTDYDTKNIVLFGGRAELSGACVAVCASLSRLFLSLTLPPH